MSDALESDAYVNRQLDKIVMQVELLSPGQRRLLFRQLKAMGLLVADELRSDSNALPGALAVRPGQKAEKDNARAPQPDITLAEPRPATRPRTGDYNSPVSGHAVVGAPGAESETPVSMPPLPGQAPEKPVHIVFDGGSRGNPGQGYGSYALDWPGQPRQIIQLKFGDKVTNNEAEYDTLIAALQALQARLQEQGTDCKAVSLSIWGDSLLVCNQIRGDWKCKEPRLQVRLQKTSALLKNFGRATLNHHPREKSVEILGH